jgi:imidazolonepropionase
VQLLIKNIRELVTVNSGGRKSRAGREMRDVGIIEHADVLIEDGLFRWIGPTGTLTGTLDEEADIIDASEQVALPGFVDCHTHLLYAGSRENEFAMRVEGKTYQEIADAGGGIMSTVEATRRVSKKDLKKTASRRLDAMMQYGTTTVEIKSGYGLNEASEVKMLEAINELADEHFMSIVPTFLGAHAVPGEFSDNPQGYVDLLCDRMLPYVAKRSLAQFCDVFCETGYFSVEQSRQILRAAESLGIPSKLHADQLSQIGASRLGAELKAVSVDHLEQIDDTGIEALKRSGSVAVVLPGVSFFLHYGYPPARELIDAGIPLALASNFNPGSCASFSMPLMMTIACTHMGMSPEEAITAVTLNGAAALKMSETVGSVEVGKQADIVLFDVPHYRQIAYYFGVNHVSTIIKKGIILEF